jgi:hypothetical protein
VASFDYCINLAVKENRISKKMGDKILDSENPVDVIKNIAGELSQQKREKVIDAIRLSQNIEYINQHPKGLGAGLVSLLSKDVTEKAKSFNVDYLQKVYTQRFAAMWSDGLERFRTKTFGLTQDSDGIAEFVRAAHGKQSSDATINGLAKAWLDVSEAMRVKFNEVGGNISKNEDWVFPQAHDGRLIEKATEDGWVSYIKPLLDTTKMLDDLGKPLQGDDLDGALRYVYQTIVTGGVNKAQGLPTPKRLATKLTRKDSEKRFLYFKDGDAWLEYQNKFGKGDVLSTITDYIQTKSSDIALVEILGTNPKNMYESLKNYAIAQSARQGKKFKNIGYYNSVYKVVSGEINGGHMTTTADALQAHRNVEVAANLGWAFFASFTDVATSALASHYNKMPIVKTFFRQLDIYASQVVNGKKGKEYRDFLTRSGVIIDTMMGRAHNTNRFTDTYGTGYTAKAADFVLRFTGLTNLSQSMQKGFAMEFAGMLSDSFKKGFDELDFKEVLVRNGITKEDWDSLRATKTIKFRNATFADLTADKSMKFHAMVLKEMEYATPMLDARTQAITTGGLQRATVGGQAVRSVMQIKSFPITVAMNQYNRTMAQASAKGKVAYGGAFVLGSTLMGGLSLQVTDMGKGRTPREVDGRFLFDAFVKGGSGSLVTDMLLVNHTQYGASMREALLGLQAARAEKLVSLTAGNVWQAISGNETNILGESVKFVEDLVPAPWQTQLIQDSIFDALRTEVDPQYQKQLRSISRRRKKEYGQDQWWERGQSPLQNIEQLSE